MTENCFYKVKEEYIDIVKEVGGIYNDKKDRPVFCCVKDKFIDGLFWAIPTSDLQHRSPEQISKIKAWCELSPRDPRWAYYFIGHTNRPAIYKISNCLPIIEKYIDGPYTSQGNHLTLKSKADIKIIRQKLSRILLAENRHNNKFEQHITDVKERMVSELNLLYSFT